MAGLVMTNNFFLRGCKNGGSHRDPSTAFFADLQLSLPIFLLLSAFIICSHKTKDYYTKLHRQQQQDNTNHVNLRPS
jgi:hypothetical protein